MYEDIRYDSPFLKEVIVRVDFSAPIDALGKTLPLKVGNAATELFPIAEPRIALAEEFQISGAQLRRTREEITEWTYHGGDREKKLTIATTGVIGVYAPYRSFEILKADFLAVLEPLCKGYPDLRIGRLGLRYINSVELPEGDPFTWKEYIDERLLGLFSRFSAERESVTRLFNIAEFKHLDGVQVKFQFGSPNPDFPAALRRSVFILDSDAYVQGLQTFQDITANIDHAHAHVQRLFEESITESLRRLMHARRAE